ncbi:Oidioi.mRNA.OKI2018_I69.chr2.g6196.t1.cds [Oikopleura dioica]|uniref:Signal recognition particle 19 kDa protein n=1 Tax=Oikopleura dioica TaxID=34765 RepID=A0ABN7T8Q4_OIKDI|nr:Oidioi.mRNA.OKI2018_I69.chr2.g6196.t1.cds [Oikopleura dioica]
MEFAHAGKPAGYAKWQSIYPLYINSKRTVKCGRKLPREQSIVDPTIDEIVQALGQLGFKNEENMLKEDKVHPRARTTWNPKDHVRGFSCYNEFGRVKYNLHSLPEENKMTKKELLIKVSEIVTTRRSTPQTESSTKPKKKKKGKK